MSEKTFDEAWKELETLIRDIEDETLPLDALAEKVKTARSLIAYCEEKLRNIEQSLSDDNAS